MQNKGKGQGCLILFGIPFAGAGCFILWALVISPIMEASKSDDWVKTPCQITKSELQVNSDSDGTSYRPIINYSYTFSDKEYTSEKIDFSGDVASSDMQAERQYIEDFPLNSSRFCFVDPDNPSDSVLIKDWGRGIFKWVAIPFGGVFAFVGFGIMLAGAAPWIFKRKKKPFHSKIKESVTLNPRKQRISNLGGAFFVMMFWNGIVSVFLVIWLGGLINGTASGFFEKWGLGLFLTPFICVGLFLLWNFYKEFRKLFAPSLTLTLKQGLSWRCRDLIDLSWNIPYSAKVDHVMIDFVCKEYATYRQGSSTSTDEETVAEYSIYDKKSLNFTGKCQFTVPDNLMPSFESNNNKIEWAIRVQTQGDGPDADDLYTIELMESSL